MSRIAIVGPSGSGKSTLANKLGKKLDIPVFHLDAYFWTDDWKEKYATKEEFNVVAEGLTKQDKWIIDGNYKKSADIRFNRADAIIFLDIPKRKCLFRVCKRVFNRKQPFDKPSGMKERVDWALIKAIVNYNPNIMRDKISKYGGKKNVFIAKNKKDVDTIILKLDNK